MASEQEDNVLSASHYEKCLSNQLSINTLGEVLVAASSVKRGQKVLDLGCGNGFFAIVLSELVGPDGKVVAVDPDGERIKIAKVQYARPNIEYLVESDQTFPGDDYDLVFCNLVIQRIKDKESLFKRLHQKIGSGGRFAFTTFPQVPDFPLVVLKAFSELIGPDFLPRLRDEDCQFVDSSTYCQLAEAAGFSVTSVEIKKQLFTVHWNSVDDFIDYYHVISHGLFDRSSIDKNTLQRFIEDHANELVSQNIVRDILCIVVTKP